MIYYDDYLARLSSREPLPPLYPSEPWQAALSGEICACPLNELLGSAVADREMAECCRAGLLVWNDDIDTAHTIVQAIENPTGSFWHAIIHRREGDANNSRYWWSQTGEHPAFAAIYEAAVASLEKETDADARTLVKELQRAGTWLPVEFVSCCEAAKNGNDEWQRRLQVAEIRSLLDWCRQRV